MTQAHASIDWVKPDGASLDSVCQAKAENKPVFLYWGRCGAHPAIRSRQRCFRGLISLSAAAASFRCIWMAIPLAPNLLGAQFKVRGYPTTILFSPNGTELTCSPGEVDAALFMQVLQLAQTPPSRSADIGRGDSLTAANLNAEGWHAGLLRLG